MFRKTENKSRETIKKIPENLKALIKESFEEAKKITSRNALNPPENYIPADCNALHSNLQLSLALNRENYSLSECEEKILNLFIPGLTDLLEQRLVANLMKTFLVQFTDYIRWINIWYIHRKGKKYFSIRTIADMKSLTSAWTKLLIKSTEQVLKTSTDSLCELVSPPHLRDIFRGTCICGNDKDLVEFVQVLVLILTNPESKEYKEFFEWVKNDTHLYGNARIPKYSLLDFQQNRFKLSNEKNYIANPKGAYMAWQIAITIEKSSDLQLAGKVFEFRVQSWEMYKSAKVGDAAQDDYKKEAYELTKYLFPLEGYEQPFFCEGLDENALDNHDPFSQRYTSGSSVLEE